MSDYKVQWLKDHRHLCASPFTKTDFRIHHNGFHVSCCCNLDIQYSTNSGTTELVDSVRAAMQRHETHPACDRCYNEENDGHISERIRTLLHHDLSDLEKFDREGITCAEPEIGVKFSNLCNLACRSCNSYDSSTFEKITKLPSMVTDITTDLSDIPAYWNTLLSHIENKDRETQSVIIHPIGGETFVQPGFYKLIEWAIDKGISERSTLRVTTSFSTPISDSLAESLKRFKKVEFLASIDSVGTNYHHVRWPAKFEKVERNLEILKNLYQQEPSRFPVTGIMPVFSLNNIFYIDEILSFWEEWIKSTRVPIHMNTMHLYRPSLLAVDILPAPYRDKLIEILTSCVGHNYFSITTKNSTMYEYIVATLEILKNDHGDVELFYDYLKFSADYDKRTGADSFHGNKKLFDLLSDDHLQIYQQHHQSTNVHFPIHYKI